MRSATATEESSALTTVITAIDVQQKLVAAFGTFTAPIVVLTQFVVRLMITSDGMISSWRHLACGLFAEFSNTEQGGEHAKMQAYRNVVCLLLY